MANVRGTRRLRLAVELICDKLEITNADIDAYMVEKRKESAPKKVEVKVLNVPDTAKLIQAVTSLEGLEEFESDDRKGVMNAVAAKKLELEKEE